MGKWAARLAEKTAAPLKDSTDKTDTTPLLAVLAVPPLRVASEIGPGLQTESPGAAAANECARARARFSRLLRWGWVADDAEKLAERLTRRDREGDVRSSCTECRHYRPGKCGNHRRAGLKGADVGRDLAGMLQRCPGFAASEGAP